MYEFNHTRRETVFADDQITVHHDHFTFPDGSADSRTVVIRPEAVAVVGIDEQGRVPLVYQWRSPYRHYFYELPAGKLDPEDKDPVAGLAREFAEEAQLKADRYEHLATLDMSAGWSNERIGIYLATGLHPAPLPPGFVLEAEEADMRVIWIPFEETLTMIEEGRITDAKTVAGLHLAKGRIK